VRFGGRRRAIRSSPFAGFARFGASASIPLAGALSRTIVRLCASALLISRTKKRVFFVDLYKFYAIERPH
jgi:hypothetical protein